MKPKDFHNQIDQPRLIAVIADAERQTAGKIYVYVSHRPITDALAQAQRRFTKMGLSHHHAHRPTVLIYIAPLTHKFAIVGNAAIHERCGEVFWKRLADQLSAGLKAGDITAALLNTVASLKATLVEHFPA